MTINGRSLDYVTPQQKLLLQLDEMEEEFELTGSRRFGNWREGSDWDFFVQYVPNDPLAQTLLHMGFQMEKDNDERYPDSQTVFVMRHPLVHIDIQFVKNFVLKKEAQKLLLMVYGFYFPKKESNHDHGRRWAWEGAYNYVRGAKK